MTRTPVDGAGGSWPWVLAAETFGGLVAARAEATPDAPLLIDAEGTVVTCAGFAAQVDDTAAALAELGIGSGTRVAWQLPTRISSFVVLGALRRLDAVQAPIIHIYREREVAAALRAADVEVFLVPGVWNGFDYTAMARGIADSGGPSPRVVEIGPQAPRAAGGPVGTPVDADDVRWIYFTSGSSGTPKGARHTDSSLLVTGRAFAGQGRLGERPGEVGAMGFPVAHVGGIAYLVSALAGGFPILMLESFVPEQAVELFRRHAVTTTGGAPPFYLALLALATPGERLLPSLRTLKGGGAPCPPHLVAAVRTALGATLAHDYGMTEVPMIGVADPTDPDDVLAATDGRPIAGNEIRLLQPDGLPGTEGEIQVRGAGVCQGYTDPAETDLAFTSDGWFRTGDLGRLHPTGHLEVVGRLKDLIIRKGENIVPAEVEALLGRHPAVDEVAVIGLPDAERGERVCAVVVLRPGADVTLTELGDHLLAAGLSRRKLPEQLQVVDALPKTGLAKVAKNELRKRFAPVDAEAVSAGGASAGRSRT